MTAGLNSTWRSSSLPITFTCEKGRKETTMPQRKQSRFSNRALGRLNQSERIEGCFVFTRDEWIVIASALDRFVTGRQLPVKARAKHIASTLFKQIRDYVCLLYTSPSPRDS